LKGTLAKLALAAFALCLASCGGGGGEERTYAQSILEVGALRWQDGTYVLRTEADWQTAWNAAEPRLLLSDGTPYRPALPAIDFGLQMVVGVVAGTGPNGCSGISIEEPKDEPGQLTIRYSITTSGGPGVACTAAVVPLVAFSSVAQSSKPVVFVARKP
jgi:hypothetical protein